MLQFAGHLAEGLFHFLKIRLRYRNGSAKTKS